MKQLWFTINAKLNWKFQCNERRLQMQYWYVLFIYLITAFNAEKKKKEKNNNNSLIKNDPETIQNVEHLHIKTW